jgi:P27 family predicted phage terminase small subunit
VEQHELWAQAVQSAPPGLLSPSDAALLEAWVVAWCLHRRATLELEQAGSLTVPSASDPGRQMPSPLITIIAKTSAIMARAVVELGFTPTSRSKVTQSSEVRVTNDPDRKSPHTISLEEYLAQGRRLRARFEAQLAKKRGSLLHQM